MSAELELDRFAANLQEVTRSLAKKHFWGLMWDSVAPHRKDVSRKSAMVRIAANEVARLAEPSSRIELNGHSASSLLRAMAETGDILPTDFEGIIGRGPDQSLIVIWPFEPSEALLAIGYKKADEKTTFVHGYFYRSADRLLGSLASRHGAASPCY